ncbi:MAG: Glycerophosphoryl diester phosphodiesterase [Pseudomonadota bacterium]
MTLSRDQAWPYPRWVAHRGAGTLAPENTLAAFRKGAEHGYRMFECDAKLSADGVVFLMHDATLQRTTNGQGLGGEKNWQQLSQLDAGGWHSRTYTGEPLPTLANVAQFCIRNQYCLNIEIKPTPGVEFKTGDAVAKEAAHIWQNETVPPLLTSFQVESLKGAQKAAPHLPRGLLLHSLPEGWLETAQALECCAVVCNFALWTPDIVEAVHQAGMKCLSYTVNDEWAAQHLLQMGTDGIITDRVDMFSPAA